MNGDEGISAVREARIKISAEHGDDPRKLGEYYMRQQEQYPDRLVRELPKQVTSDSTTGRTSVTTDTVEDKGLAAVREVRERISAEHDHDPRKLVVHYMRLQEQYADRLIEPQKRHRVSEDVEDYPQ